MSEIIKSAAKLVFMVLSATACVAYLIGVIMGRVVFETQDFMVLASMAFGFYFAHKGDQTKEYLGK